MTLSNAMVPLYSFTLASQASSINIVNIPTSGYQDLHLVCTMLCGNGGNGVAALRYNSDTAANYTNIGMYGEGGSPGSYANTVSYQYLSSTALQTNDLTIAKIDILDYTQPRYKTLVGTTALASGTYSNVMAVSSRWASTAAISALNIFINGSGTFAAGSTFKLFGIKA